MCRPEGSIEFWANLPTLFDPAAGDAAVLSVLTGQMHFLLARDPRLRLRFSHSAPGTGTRTAQVDLNELRPDIPCSEFFLALVWSPQEVRLHVGRKDGLTPLLESSAEPASATLRVAKDGSVVQVGSEGVAVMGARMYRDGALLLAPPAIGFWTDIKAAVDALLSGESDIGYLFEVVSANAVLAMLVTGFETYLEERFLELEDEGISADFDLLAKSFLSKEERDLLGTGQRLALLDEALERDTTPLRLLAERINFQNYGRAKTAYSKGYGIKFGLLPSPVTSDLLSDLQAYIEYRHRIVHVSPLQGLLNPSAAPPAEPVFSNRVTAQAALSTFDAFITTLHAASLQLRPRA